MAGADHTCTYVEFDSFEHTTQTLHLWISPESGPGRMLEHGTSPVSGLYSEQLTTPSNNVRSALSSTFKILHAIAPSAVQVHPSALIRARRTEDQELWRIRDQIFLHDLPVTGATKIESGLEII